MENTRTIADKNSLLGNAMGMLIRRPFEWFFKGFDASPALAQDRLGWLRRPLKRQAVFPLRDGQYSVKVYDQPGRWMTDEQIAELYGQLKDVAEEAMDELPRYGIFTGALSAFENRIIAIMYDNTVQQAAGFTAMVYLPYKQGEKTKTIIHLGLTMIRKNYRGQRLQTPLFKKIFLLAMFNQRCLSFIMTSIAASPAGIGAASDYFIDVFPNYQGTVDKTAFHVSVAQQVLAHHREEFGCSSKAVFDPERFVVRGSNQVEGGGAAEFIKDDPVSRYRVDACNTFCRDHLDFQNGDEMFQVGKVDFIRSSWASRKSRRRMQKKPSNAAPISTESRDLQTDIG